MIRSELQDRPATFLRSQRLLIKIVVLCFFAFLHGENVGRRKFAGGLILKHDSFVKGLQRLGHIVRQWLIRFDPGGNYVVTFRHVLDKVAFTNDAGSALTFTYDQNLIGTSGAAIQDVFEDTRSIVEPAGAIAVAGLKKWVERERWQNRQLVAVTSGANMNFDRLRHVAERADIGAEREALLAVEIPETPGSFLHFCETLGRRSVTEFNYRYERHHAAQLFVGFALSQQRGEKESVVAALRAVGYTVQDMSANEMAKLHVRFMVGGHARGIEHEQLYRFEFPERPGALVRFLQAVGTRWNISLFHYRNHGSDYGRVLAGIQVPPAERAEFLEHLNDLHYSYTDETKNPAYRIFLGA